MITPKRLFIIGGILVVLGAAIPMLMMLEIVPKWLWLEMLIALMQIFGVVMGLIGSALYVSIKRDQKDRYK